MSHDLGILRRKHRRESLKDCYSKFVLNLLIGIKEFWPGGILEGDRRTWQQGLRVVVLAKQSGQRENQHSYTAIKNRDTTLPAKVCLVKAMLLPVVMYGCESWTIKKAEH